MTLSELLEQHQVRPKQSVPDWMLGCFRRRCISFANGQSDETTNVFWFQSRNFTIDLRLPPVDEQLPALDIADYSASQLQELANYEGWIAESVWDGEQLSWRGGSSLQLHNRWPEPAQLQRIGNCMMEFAPSGAYVEDWRLQASAPGALIGLRLVSERDSATGMEYPRDGGVIICGDYAALVLAPLAPLAAKGQTLPERVAAAEGNLDELTGLLKFETSVGHGSLDSTYVVQQSTRPGRRGSELLTLDGFEWLGGNKVSQTLSATEGARERIFAIDTFEPQVEFALQTPSTEAAKSWFARESTTLTRYTDTLF